jgi:hypothetical protein
MFGGLCNRISGNLPGAYQAENMPGRDPNRRGEFCRVMISAVPAARPVFGGETYG